MEVQIEMKISENSSAPRKGGRELQRQTKAKRDKLGQNCSFHGYVFLVSLVAIVQVPFIHFDPIQWKTFTGEISPVGSRCTSQLFFFLSYISPGLNFSSRQTMC